MWTIRKTLEIEQKYVREHINTTQGYKTLRNVNVPDLALSGCGVRTEHFPMVTSNPLITETFEEAVLESEAEILIFSITCV